jgi:hypothetical protein
MQFSSRRYAMALAWYDTLAGIKFLTVSGIALSGIAMLTFVVILSAHKELRLVVQKTLATSMAQVSLAGVEMAAQLTPPEKNAAALNANFDFIGSQLSANSKFSELPPSQKMATLYLARKYRLAPQAVAVVVAEAHRNAQALNLDPLLVLSIMSIESGLNPFAQSTVGAQGLMQVMTSVHTERFEGLGGTERALDPSVNIRVGSEILRDLIDRWGSIESALKAYAGAALHPNDGGYGLKVLTERARLQAFISGQQFQAPVTEQQAALTAPEKKVLPPDTPQVEIPELPANEMIEAATI